MFFPMSWSLAATLRCWPCWIRSGATHTPRPCCAACAVATQRSRRPIPTPTLHTWYVPRRWPPCTICVTYGPCPPSQLSFLLSMAESRPRAPDFFEFDHSIEGAACVAMPLGRPRVWPPASAYSFACWVHIAEWCGAGEEVPLRLFTLADPEIQYAAAYIGRNGVCGAASIPGHGWGLFGKRLMSPRPGAASGAQDTRRRRQIRRGPVRPGHMVSRGHCACPAEAQAGDGHPLCRRPANSGYTRLALPFRIAARTHVNTCAHSSPTRADGAA